ncbi:hypothetical protein AgCh_022256 [Apium graveolens]
MKNQLLDYGLEFSKIPIYCDNQSAIAMTGNPVQHSMTKHISIRYHFIREHVMEGTVELHWVPTDQHLADIFTKPLYEATFTRLVNELGMVSVNLKNELNADKPHLSKEKKSHEWHVTAIPEELWNSVPQETETAAHNSDTLKRKKSVSSVTVEATPSLARRLKKMKAMRYLAKALSEDTEEAEEGDQESLISQELIIIKALPAQAKDTATDTVVTPPVSPIKATDDAKEKTETSEIDIHNLNIPNIPSTSTTPALEINSDVRNLNEAVPESPVASHIVVLSEHNESSSSSEDSVSAETPVPILGKEELVKKFIERKHLFLVRILTELMSCSQNADLKTQLKITALSPKHLQGLHSSTHEKIDTLKEHADKLDLQLKLDKNRYIKPTLEKIEAIEKIQEKQQAQIAEVLANQVSQKAQLEEIQSSVELLLSLLLPDDAKKGEKVVKSKCSPTEILKKKDDKGDDRGNSDKNRGQGKVQGKSSTQNKSSSDAVNAKSLKSSSDKQSLMSSSDILIQSGSKDSQKFLQTLKLKGKQTTVYYKNPKIQTLDEEIARRLFLKQNPGIDLETLKEEEARFAAEKTNLKSKASDTKKPLRPKEKGIVIREKSNSKTSKSKTRSQTEIDPKSKGKEKVGEPLKIEKKISSSIPVYQTTVHDDDLIEDETVQILKKRKIIEESKTTSNIAQVVQNKEQQDTEETTNSDQVYLEKMTIADKNNLLWNKATPVEPKSNLMMSQLATFGLRSKQPRDKAGLDSDEEKIQTGVEVTLRDPFMLTDKPYEQIKQKHLDKVLPAQIVIDAHDKENLKDKLILFLYDGLTYRLADTDVLKKISGTKTSQYIPMITEDDEREIPILKNSAKVEVILKGRCLCYNENSSHPRVIRLGDGLERISIQALRTAVYKIGDSKDEELMQVKVQLVEES